MDGHVGHRGEGGGVVGLLFYDDVDAAEQVRIARWHDELVERIGPDAAIGVADAGGRLIAVAAEHNRAGRRAMAGLYGQAAIDRCRMGELPPRDERAARPGPRPVKRKRIAGMAAEFIAAVSGPRVGREAFERRLRMCESNECGHLRYSARREYCGGCGCPRWHMAELHAKLWFARLTCPCEPPVWGPEEGRTGRIRDALVRASTWVRGPIERAMRGRFLRMRGA